MWNSPLISTENSRNKRKMTETTVDMAAAASCSDKKASCGMSVRDQLLTCEDDRKLSQCVLSRLISVKPRVTTSQSSVISPKIHLTRAPNSAKHYKKQVIRVIFALIDNRTCNC